jgi:hypothetical protein
MDDLDQHCRIRNGLVHGAAEPKAMITKRLLWASPLADSPEVPAA